MRQNLCYLLLACASLFVYCGCKKPLDKPSSLSVTGSATKAGLNLPNWFLGSGGSSPDGAADVYCARFDNDGAGSNYILSWVNFPCQVSLFRVANNTVTQVWNTPGGITIDGASFNFGSGVYYNQGGEDYYLENGLAQIVPFDYTGNGHEDHLLLYIPGYGVVKILQNMGNGNWHAVYSSTTGIGGYDMKSINDRIITYDLGSGRKNSLICYRPGGGNCWVLQNQTSNYNLPNFVGVAKGSSGIGGFDLKGVTDHLIAVYNTPGNMDLVCYRPGLGYLWYLTHTGNTTLWVSHYTSRNGFSPFNSYNLMNQADRMVPYDIAGNGQENSMICYRPGSPALTTIATFNVGLGTFSFTSPGGQFSNYPMSADPYAILPHWTTPTYCGDHVLPFQGSSLGVSSLFCYQPGYGICDMFNLSQPGQTYTQFY